MYYFFTLIMYFFSGTDGMLYPLLFIKFLLYHTKFLNKIGKYCLRNKLFSNIYLCFSVGAGLNNFFFLRQMKIILFKNIVRLLIFLHHFIFNYYFLLIMNKIDRIIHF